MAQGQERQSRVSLADLAIIECGKKPQADKKAFEMDCMKFLERNNAEALDYVRLREHFESPHGDNVAA